VRVIRAPAGISAGIKWGRKGSAPCAGIALKGCKPGGWGTKFFYGGGQTGDAREAALMA